MVSLLPFTRSNRRPDTYAGSSSAAGSPASAGGGGGGGVMARAKGALAAAGVTGGGKAARLMPGQGLPHVVLPTLQVRKVGEGGDFFLFFTLPNRQNQNANIKPPPTTPSFF